MRVVITGGGTGGHAYPATSIAEAIRRKYQDWRLLYLGSKSGPEAELANKAGIEFIGLSSRKLKKLASPDTLLTAAVLARGFLEALAVLRRFRADLVIGTGGYVAAAVVLAQALRRGHILIHEQNVIPGRTNKWLSRFADRICISFEDTLAYFPKGKTVLTGMPIRSAFSNPPDKETARKSLGLDEQLFTVLVLGGSQGARKINEIVADCLPTLRNLPIQIIHQSGRRNFEEAQTRQKSQNWENYHLFPYIEDMVTAYAASNLVVSRGGASTICEITAVGLPAVIIPYPYAQANHQQLNAEYLARAGAAVVILEANLSPKVLSDTIMQLMESPEKLVAMGKASKALGRPNAAEKVLEVAMELVGN
ncbi:MAG: undecaprenyldiphospho-muramoylpentapeptide beta-N-acetylglucosaminyltransferase [Armatimonadetes bacterium]|nr:undecaprenyldiphospho-muramoylpentapeptide beta-N-acetylglucosaminyltransferase [Armatimonadota bacterium]